MSLLHMDGFDYYTDDQVDDLPNKWVSSGFFRLTGTNSQVGRNGVGRATRLFALADLERHIPDQATIIVGFAFKLGRADLDSMIHFKHGSTTQVSMWFTYGGQLLFRQNTGVGTPDIVVSERGIYTGIWQHIEMKITFNNGAGVIEVRVNGDSDGWIPETTALDTSVTGSAICDQVKFHGKNGLATGLDDFYILDTNGSRLNDFIGDVGIETLYPTGVGAHSDFNPSAGTNWDAVNELIPDDDSTYVEDSAAGAKDRHAHGNLSTTPSIIHAVAVNPYARKIASGSRTLRAIAYDGVAEAEGSDHGHTPDLWEWEPHIFEDHPAGAAVWTAAEVNAGEFGYRIAP